MKNFTVKPKCSFGSPRVSLKGFQVRMPAAQVQTDGQAGGE